MCTPVNCKTLARPFGPEGCQVPVGNGVCGEKRTLEFIDEFKRLYETKMQEIDANGGGDCMQEKLRLQQEWIENLIEQNEMLVRAVGELEVEATERVHMLEEKLQKSAQCICEVMNKYRQYDVTSEILTEPLEKIFRLENDQKNLLEFIRRIREDRKWEYEGLSFFEISYRDLFGNDLIENYDKRYLNNNEDQEENKVKIHEGTITELTKRIDYFNSFGNVESMAKDLKCKTDECESLKQSMIDMRQALTEEVASKHDIILQLKREVQQLEEKCIQADKQTAFRDDIVKELRKEIKQLKQQLTQDEVLKLHATINELQTNLQRTKDLQDEEEKLKAGEITKLKETVESLKKKLKDALDKSKVCKICKGRSKVGFAHSTEVQASLDEEQIQKQMELLQHRDEIIKVQTDTLGLLQNELQNLKERECESRVESERQYNELNSMKNRVKELENELRISEEKASNLQVAVDLYLNSINVLEATEEKCKLEMNQQRATIANLQCALVSTKQELDSMKQKSDENELQQRQLISQFASMMTDKENEKKTLEEQVRGVSQVYEELQDLTFELEVEHCTVLQDVDILDNQLHKYQTLLKSEEEDNKQFKNQIVKLQKQKKCFEEVISYFREEMALMADQLQNLQELLTLSHASMHEENNKLQKTCVDVKSINEELSSQLKAAEQKLLLENQMNQLNESKICELEKLISDKELDLGRHDRAILNIRQTLQCSLKQNEDLHMTIVSLNNTISKLQGAIKKYEQDNAKSKQYSSTCQEQIDSCKTKLEELKVSLEKKTTEICMLEMAYNSQNRTLKSAQMELKEMKEKQKEKQCHVKCILGELEEKLKLSEQKYNKLMEEYKKLETQLGIMNRRETIKEVEIQRFRQIIAELKKTLIDLNKKLTKQEFKAKCQNEACGKSNDQDATPACPCEVEFCQNIAEYVKISVIDLQTKLNETQKKNSELEEKCKCTEARVAEITKKQLEKDKEYNELRKKLTEKLRQAQQEESRYLELAGQFEKELGNTRQELEMRTLQLDDVKKSAQEINSSRCIQLACAQEEVNRLKEELNKLLRKHCNLNAENERLHSQSAQLQSTVANMEEKSQLLTDQLEQYLMELQTVQTDKESLVQKNRELLSELRSLQNSYAISTKQQRYAGECLKTLECELGDLRTSRDEICLESKNVINYVRSWLQEQKKINRYLASKEKNYCITIEKLRQENEELQFHHSSPKSQRTYVNNIPTCLRGAVSPPPMCQSPWSLGSQGTMSYHEDSPSQSPCMNEECDWYSTNFRNYSEDEEEENDWVNKVEDLAAQVRKTNKMWKNKLNGAECAVTKDTKK